MAISKEDFESVRKGQCFLDSETRRWTVVSVLGGEPHTIIVHPHGFEEEEIRWTEGLGITGHMGIPIEELNHPDALVLADLFT